MKITKSQLKEIIREEISKLNEDSVVKMGYKKEKIVDRKNGEKSYYYTLSGTHSTIHLPVWERLNGDVYLQNIRWTDNENPRAGDIVYGKTKKFKNKSGLESYIKKMHPRFVEVSNGGIDHRWKW